MSLFFELGHLWLVSRIPGVFTNIEKFEAVMVIDVDLRSFVFIYICRIEAVMVIYKSLRSFSSIYHHLWSFIIFG